MSNEQLLTIISLGGLILTVTLALAGLILVQARATRREMKGETAHLRENMEELRGEIGELRERMAHLAGLLEGLREAITRRVA